jgi:hypothetical protein
MPPIAKRRVGRASVGQASIATSQTNHNSLLLKKAYQIFGVYVRLPKAKSFSNSGNDGPRW